MANDIENPAQDATDIFHPDSDGNVKLGLPSDTPSRGTPTGIPGGTQPDDIPEPGKKRLADWLNDYASKNITPPPSQTGDGTSSIDPSSGEFADPNTGPFAPYEHGEEVLDDDITYGPDGNANRYLIDIGNTDAGDTELADSLGAYQNPASSGTTTATVPTAGILANNRFQPGQPFTGGVRNWANTQKTSGRSGAASLGVYDKDFDGLAMSELQNIAEQLLFNAVGDSVTPFSNDDPRNKTKATFDIGDGTLSFTTQLGRGRDQYDADLDFRPSQAVNAAKTLDRGNRSFANGQMNQLLEPADAVNDLPGTENVRRSFGVLNNHLEKFGGALPTSMIVLAAVAAITIAIVALVITLVLDLLGLLLGLFSSPGSNALAPFPAYQQFGDEGPDPAKLPMGAAFGNSDFGATTFIDKLWSFFGIPQLLADYDTPFVLTTAAAIGATEFFIGNSLQSPFMFPQITTTSAGYYVIVSRNAMRDMDQITNAAEEMGGGGGVAAIEGFFALIDAFRSSATFRMTATLIQIGDTVKRGPGTKGQRDNDGRVIPSILPEHQSRLKTIGELGSSVRLAAGSSRLAYSFSALPQVYLRPGEAFNGHTLPPTIQDKSNDGQEFDILPTHDLISEDLQAYSDALVSTDVLIGPGGIGVEGDSSVATQFQNRLSYVQEGRIPTAFRKKMEEQLNAYYVPFYFHDLRTNEILPLPAFVENITDSFTPEYSEVGGFGRMDKVQIYGGTTRRIGFSFWMAATSPSDYSALYYGINKLVSMVYPQWGGGRFITNANGQRFQVPFSYTMTASPLIRLRLGELFASNRTPETVRRLFGANDPRFALSEDPDDGTVTRPQMINSDEVILNKPALEAISSRAQSPKMAWGGLFVSITNFINPGGTIGMFNFAGADKSGQGGVFTHNDGKPFLLPADVLVHVAGGKYPGAEWNGVKWKTRRLRGTGRAYKDSGFVGKIVNYRAKRIMKTYNEKQGGHGKEKYYYIIAPAPPGIGPLVGGTDFTWDKGNSNCAGVQVPIENVTFASIQAAPTDHSEPPPLNILGFEFPNPRTEPIRTDGEFFDENPIVKAMDDSGGAGVAGVIKSLDFDWNSAPWETDADLGRAPQFCKVTMTFTPIHDEPLGLNPDGSLRAAAYPVGDAIRKIFGRRFGLPGTNDLADKFLAAAQKAKALAEQAANENAEADESESS